MGAALRSLLSNLLPPLFQLPELVLEEPQWSADLCHWLVEEVKSTALLPVALWGQLREGMAQPVWPINICQELAAPGTMLGAL